MSIKKLRRAADKAQVEYKHWLKKMNCTDMVDTDAGLALNTVLYIQQRRERGDLVKRINNGKGRGAHRTYKVETSVQLPSLARIPTEGGSATWKVTQRFIVRGHWRNQAYGTGLKERRRRWIEPHWKGPEEGARLPREFFVEERS